jgi:DNA repair photolyase
MWIILFVKASYYVLKVTINQPSRLDGSQERDRCNHILEALADKEREDLIRNYEKTVGREGVRKAKKDQHSRRMPIQCGLTIHPGSDCSYSCIYCYIIDMGFKFQAPRPCRLTPQELTLALLYNPNFVPGRNGTYIAIGSVIEPFQPQLRSLTIGYIAEMAILGNPIQFSSKSYITSSDAKVISSSCDWISPLVTILTLDESKAKMLEPLAPTPAERLETINNLAGAGLKPFLFLRPIMPGIITVEENIHLINEAIHHGCSGLVMGNFRVTTRIIEAIRKKGFNVSDLIRRTKVIDEKQRAVWVSDIQREIENHLKGVTTLFRRACCASTYCAGLKHCIHEVTAPHPICYG